MSTRNRPIARAARRSTTWVDTNWNLSTASGGEELFTLLPGIVDPDPLGWTLTRVLLCYSVFASVPTSATGYQAYDVGIGIASNEAFAVGVTGIPNVGTAADHPERGWVYRCRHVVGDSTVVPLPNIDVFKDIRSQRKLDRGVLYLTSESLALVGTAVTLRFAGLARCLFRLP